MSRSACLYFQVELRAVTLSRSGSSRPSCVIISSVRPSLRYSWSASPERLSKGRTASVSLWPGGVRGLGRPPTQWATRAAEESTPRTGALKLGPNGFEISLKPYQPRTFAIRFRNDPKSRATSNRAADVTAIPLSLRVFC